MVAPARDDDVARLLVVAVGRRLNALHDSCRFSGNVADSLAGVSDSQQPGVFGD